MGGTTTRQSGGRTGRPRSSSGPDWGAVVARVVGLIGRGLVVAGLLLLYYTAYLLWGTNVYTRGVQNELAKQVAAAPIITESNPQVQAGEIPAARPAQAPAAGAPLFEIVVPRLGLRTVVVEGVGREELKAGPGHFPESPWPGEEGNVALSGHRTTFGAPFFRLNELQAGDLIAIESGPARYKYRVTEQKIVAPHQVEVVESRGKNELTLTTCHPRFSAAQRLIIHADYEGPELKQQVAPAPVPKEGPIDPADEAAQQPAADPSLVPAAPPVVPPDVLVLLGVSVAMLLLAMGLSKRLRAAAVWSALVLIGAGGLWVGVFPQILRLMPANY